MTVKTEPWTECPDGSVENVRFAGKHSAVGLFLLSLPVLCTEMNIG